MNAAEPHYEVRDNSIFVASGIGICRESHSLTANSINPCKSVPLAKAISFKRAASLARHRECHVCVCVLESALGFRQKVPDTPLSHITPVPVSFVPRAATLYLSQSSGNLTKNRQGLTGPELCVSYPL